MEVLEPGHTYKLQNKHNGYQIIQFVKDNLGFQQSDSHDGILCQELLRVLIDRVNFLNEQVCCHENIEILRNLKECIILFEKRALARKLEKLTYIHQCPTGIDGHIFKINERSKI